jgi:hypothetical protein
MEEAEVQEDPRVHPMLGPQEAEEPVEELEYIGTTHIRIVTRGMLVPAGADQEEGEVEGTVHIIQVNRRMELPDPDLVELVEVIYA